jgi:hypothetical protein
MYYIRKMIWNKNYTNMDEQVLIPESFPMYEIIKLHFGYLRWYMNCKLTKRYSSPAVEVIMYFPEAVTLGVFLKLSLIAVIAIKK